MMKVTFNTIFTVTERHLLRHNQLFMLNSSSSHSENESDANSQGKSDVNDIQKALFFGSLLEGAMPKKQKEADKIEEELKKPEETDAVLSDISNEKDQPKLL